MDKYLKQLLEKYAKVILPSFGAIVVENEETGNLMFNEYLSYNDGKLDDLIVSESNMELQEAQNMIAKYIRDIQVQIDKGESYDIFELGRFHKNDDGDIEFEGNLKEGPKSQDKKEPTKVAAKSKTEQPKKEQKAPKAEESKKESKPAPKKEESVKEKEVDSKVQKEKKSDSKSTPKENKFVPKKEKEEPKSDKEKPKSIANKKEEAKADKSKSKTEEKKKKEKAVASKSSKDKKGKQEKPQKDQSKKKRFGAFFWILIVVLGLASAGLIYVGLNYDKVKSYMGWNEFDGKEDIASSETQEKIEDTDNDDDNSENSSEDVVADTSEASSVELNEEANLTEENNESEAPEPEVEPEPEPEEEPEPQPELVKTASNGTHHLIAGSFSDKSNAEGLVQDLKAKGLDARILGQFGGLHFVAAASYNSSKEASNDLDRVRQHASGAWLFKYNDN